MTTPDPTLAARLAESEDIKAILSGRARFLLDRGEVKTPELLMQAWRRISELEIAPNQLITTAEADARVKAAVLAEMEAAKSMVWTLGHEIKASMLVDEDNERAVLDMVKATAAAIRLRGVTG